MTQRVLFVFDWLNTSYSQLLLACSRENECDELIFLIECTEEIPSCSHLLEVLKEFFVCRVSKPFYLLPVAKKGISNLHHWLRWRILSPAFQKVYIDTPQQQAPLSHILGVPVEVCPQDPAEQPFFPYSKDIKAKSRGLFILRAQPFHLGHAAIIEHICQEQEEIIVVIAMANLSHTTQNIATAGERLAMILPYLHEVALDRFYLIAMPYSDYTLENFLELKHLLPSFHCVYTNNPCLEALAYTAGFPVKNVATNCSISGNMIRENILLDRPYASLVPSSAYAILSGLVERLKLIHSSERR